MRGQKGSKRHTDREETVELDIGCPKICPHKHILYCKSDNGRGQKCLFVSTISHEGNNTVQFVTSVTGYLKIC